MKIVIFAGGVGTRLWPLSRKHSPKQFEKVVGEKSTLQLTVERLLPAFGAKELYISTNRQYLKIVGEQAAEIPAENIIGEPKMRDVGPAVGLMTAILIREAPNTPMVILWSDHIVREEKLFRKILLTAEGLIKNEPNKIIFIGQKPRFASQNLGWIEYGKALKEVSNVKFHQFLGFRYRPDSETAQKFFRGGRHAWNLGYFVTTPAFVWDKYAQFAPKMHEKLKEIQKAWKTTRWEAVLERIYPKLEKTSFDNAILEKLSPSQAYVVSEDLRWSDVGAWEALKEALEISPEQNVIQGRVLLEDTKDSLVYNYNNQQLLVTIDLDGMLVVNTHDVVLVCKKDSVPKIKRLVERLAGTENEHLT